VVVSLAHRIRSGRLGKVWAPSRAELSSLEVFLGHYIKN
jgi:hypothetical protein